MKIGRATGGVSAVGKPGTAHQFRRRELVAVPVLRRTPRHHPGGVHGVMLWAVAAVRGRIQLIIRCFDCWRINPLKIVRATVVLLGVSLFAAGLPAEEGMWMPQQIPEIAAKLRALGFKGDPKAFADLSGEPMGAIVSLGGCTASDRK